MPPRALIAAAAIAALGGAAAAQPQDAPDWRKSKGVFCAALARALRAAQEPAPFASLKVQYVDTPDVSRLTIPGFAHARYCTVRAGSLYCSQTLAPPELTLENLTADTARCLGREPEEIEGFQVFDMGKIAIQIESECTDECHVGRLVTYRIEVD